MATVAVLKPDSDSSWQAGRGTQHGESLASNSILPYPRDPAKLQYTAASISTYIRLYLSKSSVGRDPADSSEKKRLGKRIPSSKRANARRPAAGSRAAPRVISQQRASWPLLLRLRLLSASWARARSADGLLRAAAAAQYSSRQRQASGKRASHTGPQARNRRGTAVVRAE